MWDTKLQPNLPSPYEKRGICIGDVGVIRMADGYFSFAFNLFLPHDDPLNTVDGLNCPPGHVPLSPPTESEITSVPQYFLPGSVVASKGVTVTRVSETPIHLELDSSEPEAAFTILPHGASRQDMVSTRITEYLKEHAFNWIRHFSSNGIVPNGSLYIVTGHDKARTSHLAAFPARMVSGSRRMTAKYVDGKLHCKENTREYPRDPLIDPVEEQECVFLRGIRLSSSGPDWDHHFPGMPLWVTPASLLLHTPPLSDLLEYVPSDSESESEDLSHNNAAPVYNNVHGDANVDNPVDEDVNDLASVHTTSISNQSSADDFSDDSAEVEHPKALKTYPFHPSDIVAQIMLNECPRAKLALVDDHIWSVLSGTEEHETSQAPVTYECTQGGFVSDFSIIMEIVFKFYDIVEKDVEVAIVVRKANGKSSYDSQLSKLFRRFWPKQSREARLWTADLVGDLVRQGEDSLGGEKYSLRR
ncbi:hypothetical protein CVT25_003710 [Psilocybe cyanescens]|uniref:Uncharacterized protein n=1 Tax=Psilocybe cyanescens TaxID=93625 RepID=A0A409WX85_PSICY|nr:hypothetical protein CVT25_003710 [Psilocybe cyanescens]